MAIGINLNAAAMSQLMKAAKAPDTGDEPQPQSAAAPAASQQFFMPALTMTSPIASAIMQAGAAKPAAQLTQTQPVTATLSPGLLAAAAQAQARPTLVGNTGIIPPIFFQPVLLDRTTTQVAQEALTRLRNAPAAVVNEAVATVNNKRVAAKNMMRYLERKVIIGEVLNSPAAKWDADTREDFAEAFQMANTKTDVMDAIVAIAILNDPDLIDELQDENASDASGADLLENRRVVAQYPPPGTPLEAPYLVLVAVEHRDTRRADEVIKSITGDLVERDGFKLPRAAGGRGR